MPVVASRRDFDVQNRVATVFNSDSERTTIAWDAPIRASVWTLDRLQSVRIRMER